MKKYFSFTRNQKLGVVTYSVLIIGLVVLLNVNFHKGISSHDEFDENKIVYYEFEKADSSSYNSDFYVDNESKPKVVLKEFNPNELDVEGWESVGFSNKQAQSIVKYHQNYGPFYKAEDVQKIYIISDQKYNEIEPFMVFNSDRSDAPSNTELVEVNTATKEELESIRGIGPAFSDRIIKYRTILGGFYSKEQYSEIYGLKDESLQALTDNTVIDVTVIQQIHINSISKSELKRHPYLNKWEVITAIISGRDKKKLLSLDFLVSDEILSQEELNTILPYLSFD